MQSKLGPIKALRLAIGSIIRRILLIRTRLRRVRYLAPSIVLVVLLAALTPVLLASCEEKEAKLCQNNHNKCEDQVIARVLDTPDDPESVAQTALAVYGPIITALQQSESSLYKNLSPNLETSYDQLNEGLRSGRFDPACVRDGLAELLIKDKLDSARAQILASSFDAIGTTAGLGPAKTRSLEFYFNSFSNIPEMGVFLVGTYKHYVDFPYLMMESTLMCPSP